MDQLGRRRKKLKSEGSKWATDADYTKLAESMGHGGVPRHAEPPDLTVFVQEISEEVGVILSNKGIDDDDPSLTIENFKRKMSNASAVSLKEYFSTGELLSVSLHLDIAGEVYIIS